jgi:hypothetical protein
MRIPTAVFARNARTRADAPEPRSSTSTPGRALRDERRFSAEPPESFRPTTPVLCPRSFTALGISSQAPMCPVTAMAPLPRERAAAMLGAPSISTMRLKLSSDFRETCKKSSKPEETNR